MGMDRSAESASPKNSLILLFYLALALLVPLIGIAYLDIETPEVEADAYQNLQNIAHLKAERIESWLSERQGDALLLKNSENLTLRIEQFQKLTRRWTCSTTGLAFTHRKRMRRSSITEGVTGSVRSQKRNTAFTLRDIGSMRRGSGNCVSCFGCARYAHARSITAAKKPSVAWRWGLSSR